MPFPIRVNDLMSAPVRTASRDDAAGEAAARFAEEGVSSLVVTDDGDPVGIVTSTDLVGLLGGAADPRTRPLGEFMSSPVVTVEPDAPVGDAAERMRTHGVSRLVVVDDDGAAGVITTDDIDRHVPQVIHRHRFEPPPRAEYQFRVRRETAYEKSDWEFECACVAGDAVSVGDRVTFSKTISDHDVREFATASGDTNRLHLDDAYAAETRFGRRIAHGTLISGVISAALARLPGVTIYLSQDLSFLAPVDVGERVTAVCELVDSLGRGKYELTTDVFGEDGEQVIEGEAAVLIDEAPGPATVEYEAIA